jgi:ankyrin repeat domain-containing protein 50
MIIRWQNVPDDVSNLYLQHRDNQTEPTVEECSDLLWSVTREYPIVYVVIDALDECVDENFNPIWEQLIRTLKKSVSNLRLLCSSRSIEDIAGVLAESTHIEVEASDDDIRSYVKAEVENRSYLRDICMQDTELSKKIVEAVPSASHHR